MRPHLRPLALWFIAAGWANGVSYQGMADAFGVSRACIASAIRRYVRKIPDPRTDRAGRNRTHRGPKDWGSFLTETWAERKARLAAERSA